MPNELDQYTVTTADWRKSLKQNNRKTRVVIVMFFLIYGALGLLIDMYLRASQVPLVMPSQLFMELVTFKIFPIATIIMLIIAGICLLISYMLYDKIMMLGTEYHEVTPETAKTLEEQTLYNIIDELRIASGLKFMPRVFIINADYMNAFASGYSEKSAMVAITRGLMEKLKRDEIEAVMAHELSHIRHLDIKLTLTASLLANMSLIVLDMFFYNAIFANQGNLEGAGRRNPFISIIILLRYSLPIITALLLLYLSRKRELMADAGAVELMRENEPLARALLKINQDSRLNRDAYAVQYQQPHENVRREAYIYDPVEAGFAGLTTISDLFSTHPSLEERLAALGYIKRKS